MLKIARWPHSVNAWFHENPTGKSVLSIADALGKLAIVATIISYFVEAPDRQKAKEFQAWQVINTARQGDGGRKLALHDLISDHVDLSGLEMTGVNLDGVDLRGAKLTHAYIGGRMWSEPKLGCEPNWSRTIFSDTCRSTDLSDTVIAFCQLSKIDFSSQGLPIHTQLDGAQFGCRTPDGLQEDRAVFNQTSFDGNVLYRTEFRKVDFFDTSFKRVIFSRAKFTDITFGNADFEGASFEDSALVAWTNMADRTQWADGRFDDDLPNFANATFKKVTIDGHPITEADFKWGILCHTDIEGLKSDRDCTRWERQVGKAPPPTR
jgi:uncharacterized protein YjbI with pentapeptide repeats